MILSCVSKDTFPNTVPPHVPWCRFPHAHEFCDSHPEPVTGRAGVPRNPAAYAAAAEVPDAVPGVLRASCPSRHCVRTGPYRRRTSVRSPSPRVAIAGSAPLAALAARVSSRSPLQCSNSSLCRLSASRAREGSSGRGAPLFTC